jgi:hypothetical protein
MEERTREEEHSGYTPVIPVTWEATIRIMV